MTQDLRDEMIMRAALREAQKGIGRTSPNPAVGAVLSVNGKIVAKGYHRGAGQPHAEVECLRAFARPAPKNAALYVTLEPCSTRGRTGACTEAIIQSGIRQVVIGATDPNPGHAGRGMKILTQAGVSIRVGILAQECTALNEAYNKWICTGHPFVIAKCGMTLDGRLARRAGEPRWITSAASRRHAQALRARVDAILIGAETLRTDNPRLTVRAQRQAKQPWRIVLSRSGSLPTSARLFTDRFADRTIVYRNKNLAVVLKELGKKEITSVLIEGGGDILGQALDQKLIDQIQLYVAPIFTGGPVVAFSGMGARSTVGAARIQRVGYQRIGQDICVTGYPTYDTAIIE
ncbi:MAG: bifunctional diaminohydroxyphosphoribosylaminopyrimidine deaminase/5-amino-6-(5-phosphoribosylamino)uracil reductase RibD [Verrucomicrobiota bacterium]